MKATSRASQLRLNQARLSEKLRLVTQIGAMIRDLSSMRTDIEYVITKEQERTGIHDQHHFAYSTYAKAAALRLEKLNRSIEALQMKLGEAKAEASDMLDRLQTTARLEAAHTTNAAA